MVLRLEHVEHVRAERLRGLHDERPGRVLLACRLERRRGAVHRHAGADQRVHERRRRREVALIGRQDVAARVAQLRIAQHLVIYLARRSTRPRQGVGIDAPALQRLAQPIESPRIHRPGVRRSALDGVAAHAPDVEQERLAVARGDVEHRAVGRDRVVDALAEVPALRRDGIGQVVARQRALRTERDLHRRRVADGLGQQPDHVVEVHRGPQAAVPPRRVVRAAPHRHPGLPLAGETRVHRRADEVEARRHERVVDVVERIAKRRGEHDGAGRARLVVVVHDLREPLAEQDAVHVGRLGQRGHVRVAVVVVPRVLLVQHRQRGRAPTQRIRLAEVPVGDELVAVRIGMRCQDDHVVEKAQGLGVIARGKLVDELDQLLRAEHFVGMQAAVDPDDRTAFRGEGTRFVLGGHVLGQCEPSCDLAIAPELAVVRGRGNDGHQVRPSFFRPADLDERHPLGLGIEAPPVVGHLAVGDELIVVADVEAELLARRGHRRLPEAGRRRHQGRHGGQHQSEDLLLHAYRSPCARAS